MPVGEVSGRGSVRSGKCPVGEVSGRGSVRSGKCPVGEVSGRGKNPELIALFVEFLRPIILFRKFLGSSMLLKSYSLQDRSR